MFAAARRLLRPGGGVASITHGRPIWLGERDWARAQRAYLERWFGPITATSRTDDRTLREPPWARTGGFMARRGAQTPVRRARGRGLRGRSPVLRLPPGRIAADARDDFEAGLGAALQPHTNAASDGSLIKDVPVDVLRGRR